MTLFNRFKKDPKAKRMKKDPPTNNGCSHPKGFTVASSRAGYRNCPKCGATKWTGT